MVKNKSKNYSVKKRTDSTIAKRTIITVICLAIITVGAAIAYKFLLNEEKLSKGRMDALAKEYYEGYIYENLINGAMDQAAIEKAMEKYTLRGFASVNLRQLLLYEGYDSPVSAADTSLITKHCDENTTSVKFYPETPFDKKSYHLEFNYDCDF